MAATTMTCDIQLDPSPVVLYLTMVFRSLKNTGRCSEVPEPQLESLHTCHIYKYLILKKHVFDSLT
jgi:hypothetical protein